MISISANASEVQRALRDLERAIVDLRPVMRGIAMELLAETEENFSKQGRPEWAELAEATKEGRKGAPPYAILQDKGALARSVRSDSGAAFARIGVAGDEEVNAYAKIHQFGGEAGRKSARVKIPARPYLPLVAAPHSPSGELQPEAREAILDLVMEHLQRAARVI